MTTATSDRPQREYTLTPEQRVVMRKLKSLRKRHDRVLARVEAIEEERTDLYLAGRNLVPPLTFRQLADVFDVTTQSVIQKLDRRERRANGD